MSKTKQLADSLYKLSPEVAEELANDILEFRDGGYDHEEQPLEIENVAAEFLYFIEPEKEEETQIPASELW